MDAASLGVVSVIMQTDIVLHQLSFIRSNAVTGKREGSLNHSNSLRYFSANRWETGIGRTNQDMEERNVTYQFLHFLRDRI